VFRKGNTKKIILFGILIISTLAIMNYTEFGRVGVSPMESAMRDILAPVQGLAMNLGHRLRGLVSFPFTLINISEENQLMKKRVNELEGRIRLSEELRSENDRLKKLLDFKTGVASAVGLDVTGAAVIGRDPGNWFGMITINKGSRHGIKVNMTVLNDQGLIGRITSVSSGTAEVLLITDPRSGVGSLIQETRAPGMVQGEASYPGKVRMVHIPLGTELGRGHIVVTSGFGSIYPKGIPIGWIQESGREPSGLFISAEVAPFVDFNRLEEVMVITGARTPAVASNISVLPHPWGQGNTDVRGRSPGAIRSGEQGGVINR